jgi:hypothetical protein
MNNNDIKVICKQKSISTSDVVIREYNSGDSTGNMLQFVLNNNSKLRSKINSIELRYYNTDNKFIGCDTDMYIEDEIIGRNDDKAIEFPITVPSENHSKKLIIKSSTWIKLDWLVVPFILLIFIASLMK